MGRPAARGHRDAGAGVQRFVGDGVVPFGAFGEVGWAAPQRGKGAGSARSEEVGVRGRQSRIHFLVLRRSPVDAAGIGAAAGAVVFEARRAPFGTSLIE